MKEINISKVIIKYRKSLKITQQELAEYLGVSKASVSKWELGISYPDITLLPVIAAYFDISLDELMNYEPRLDKEQIKDKYACYCKEFANKEFEQVLKSIEDDIKKYYSCYEYLLVIIILLINHYEITDNKEVYLNKIISLIEHILSNSKDINILNEVRNLKMSCLLLCNKPQEIIDMDEGISEPKLNNEILVATAYTMLNQLDKAEEIYQIYSFNSVMALVSYNIGLIQINMGDRKRIDTIIDKNNKLIDTFELLKIQPQALLSYYYLLINFYISNNEFEEMENELNNFYKVCDNLRVLEIKGDAYFNKLDDYINKSSLGNTSPRSSKIIKNSIKGLFEAEIFDNIKADDKYNKIIKKIYLAIDKIDDNL